MAGRRAVRSVLAIWGCFTYGRLTTRGQAALADPAGKTQTPFAVKVGKGAVHRGSGCTPGDIVAAQFVRFRALIGGPLEVDRPEFWFMMQIAMVAGFATRYPVGG